jgi:hypothetical protein
MKEPGKQSVRWQIEPALEKPGGVRALAGKYRWLRRNRNTPADKLICMESAEIEGSAKLGHFWKDAKAHVKHAPLRGRLHETLPVLELDYVAQSGVKITLQYVVSDMARKPLVASIIAVDPQDEPPVSLEEVKATVSLLQTLKRIAIVRAIIEALKEGF